MTPEFRGLIEELFEMDAGALDGGRALTDLPGWSSLMFVGLIAMVDEEYGFTLAPKTILECKSVNELAEIVEEQRSQSKAA